jgi:cell division protein FtsW
MFKNLLQMGCERWIESIVIVLMAIGTVFVYSAGATVTGGYDLSRFYDSTVLKQLVFFPLAVGVMYAVSRVPYQWYRLEPGRGGRSLTPYLLVVSLLLLAAVMIWGVERNFSRRWLDIAPGPTYVSFQPSELAKWVMIIFLAAYMDRFADSLRLYWKCFVPACLAAGLAVGLIIKEDFGTAAFIAVMAFVMLWLGGAVWWHFLTPLPVVVPGFLLAILSSETRLNRIRDFMDPESISYQARQSLIAIGTGGLWGKGLGRGVLKYGHLPEDTTDFIFAIIAEEMGFAACIAVILLFVLFAIWGILAAVRCQDRFGRLLAAGIVIAIVFQAAVNLGVVTVVLPTKGIPLPFISAGGTSMLLTAGAVGILLNIARQENDEWNSLQRMRR